MLDSFKTPYQKLSQNLDEISEFIDSVLTSKISRSTVSYNAVIISIYGCYENFVNSLVEELLMQISSHSDKHTDIPTDMKIRNIHLSSDYLNSKQRYKNFRLNEEEVINNIYTGRITNKLLLKHSGNLSATAIDEYFKNLGIKNVTQSIKNCNEFCQYYSNIKTLPIKEAKSYLNKIDTKTTFSLLDDIIIQRNAIAHSWKSDDKVDYNIIKDEWIIYIRVFCKCLFNIVVEYYSEWLVNHNKLLCLSNFQIYGSSIIGFYGVIPHYNNTNETAIVKLNEKIHICDIKNVMIYEDHKASMEIVGYHLDKAKSDKYSFYFDKEFITEYKCANNVIEYD